MKRWLGVAAAAGLCAVMLRADVRTSDQPDVGQQQREAAFDALAARTAQGPVRVIVGVPRSARPEGELAGARSVADQRAGIAAAQNNVMALIPPQFLDTVKRFTVIPYMALEVDAATLAALRSSPAVTSIGEDLFLRATLATSVPFIGAPTAWAAGYTGAGWSVAILDSGVDKTHPFLMNKVVSEACYSTTNSSVATSSVCPGGAQSSTAPGSGVNCAFSSCEHGTHVAGIAAGFSGGLSGVARDASLIAIQVFSRDTSDGTIGSFSSDQILALERVLALKDTFRIAAVNLSLGGGTYTSQAFCDSDNPATKAIIDQLRSFNIATVIASGNDGFINAMSAPACISTAVSVGSVTDGAGGTTSDQVSNFSNSASFLSLLAPGQHINSSVPGGGFSIFDGTSMATPHVAGTWALMKSANSSSTVAHVLSVLQAKGKPVFEQASGFTKSRILVAPAAGFLGSEGTQFDYDADHTADIAVYRRSTGEWFVRGIVTAFWGDPSLNDIPVPADYNGDKRIDIAVYRASTGTWFVRGLAAVFWGVQSAGDIPVPADYNGDRLADIAAYRATTGTWFIRNGGTVQWGDPASNDIPVPADYDGDGKADIAVYRRSTGQWFVTLPGGGFTAVSWGDPAQNDVPVPADYDGDGKADLAMYRPAAGTWFVRPSSGPTQTTTWGVQSQGDVPVPADYNADGRADIAVYRTSTGVWFIRNIATVGWGVPSAGDIPAR
jgi:subtilisin